MNKSVLPESALPGATVTYTLAYTNVGGSPASNVSLTDSLPAGISYVPNSAGNQASYNAATNTITWSLGSLAANGSGQVTFQAVVSSQATVGSTINNWPPSTVPKCRLRSPATPSP